VSYGHADKIARSGKESGEQHFPADLTPKTEDTFSTRPVALPPEWYARLDLVPVLRGHDIGALYRWLN
jgi:hypothetical protein